MSIKSKWRRPRWRRLNSPPNELIAAKIYAQKYNISISNVKYRIATNRLEGWKSYGRWYVADTPPD